MEFQFRTDYQFDILRSRNRSRAAVDSGIRCTLNPDSGHFVYDWVKHYLDEEGFPIKELSGKTRYYLIVNGELDTSWSYEDLYNKYYDPDLPLDDQKIPQTYTYIPATLDDNEVLLKMDPEYKANLNSMPEKKRKQLLLGCWALDEDDCLYFKRSWLKEAPIVPVGSKRVRAYDLGYSEPTPSNRYPDFTVGIGMAKCPKGDYYIFGDFVEDFKDDKTLVYGRMRKRSGDRDNVILKQAEHDLEDCFIILPKEGAAGKDSFEQKRKFFSEAGFIVKQEDVPVNLKNKKIIQFAAFGAEAEHGNVYIVKSSFNKPTLEWLLTELERFDGLPSTGRKKDDAPDSVSMAYRALQKHKVFVPLNLSSSAPTTQISTRDRPTGGLPVGSVPMNK